MYDRKLKNRRISNRRNRMKKIERKDKRTYKKGLMKRKNRKSFRRKRMKKIERKMVTMIRKSKTMIRKNKTM